MAHLTDMKKVDEAMRAKFDSERMRCAFNVMFTAGWMKNRTSTFLEPFNLSPQQFNILRILRGAKDWLNMHDVKDRMVEKSPNTTRLCDKLMQKELVDRRRSESDRRVVFLRITQPGLDLLKEIDEVEVDPRLEFLSKITEEEAKMVSDILDKMRS